MHVSIHQTEPKTIRRQGELANPVAVYEEDSVVGHVPYNLAPHLSFLARDVNKAFAVFTGAKVVSYYSPTGMDYSTRDSMHVCD